MLTLEISEEVQRRLEDLARSTGRSQSFHAQEALVEYLDDLEDYHLAELEMEEIRAGRSIPLSLDDVLTSHGMAD